MEIKEKKENSKVVNIIFFWFTYKIVSALLLQVLTSQLEWNEHFYWGTICKYNGNKTLQAESKIFHQNFTKRIPPAIEKPVFKEKINYIFGPRQVNRQNSD